MIYAQFKRSLDLVVPCDFQQCWQEQSTDKSCDGTGKNRAQTKVVTESLIPGFLPHIFVED